MKQATPILPPLTPMLRWFFLGCGMLCVGMGVIGIFVPVWPSTVFFLGASFFFARSSPRLQRKLLEHPRIGPMLVMAHGRAMPRRAKIISLTMMWSAILISSWVTAIPIVAIVAVSLGLIGSLVILFWIRTVPNSLSPTA